MVLKESVFVAPSHLRDIFGEMMWHGGGFCKTTHEESQLTEPSPQLATPEDTRGPFLYSFPCSQP